MYEKKPKQIKKKKNWTRTRMVRRIQKNLLTLESSKVALKSDKLEGDLGKYDWRARTVLGCYYFFKIFFFWGVIAVLGYWVLTKWMLWSWLWWYWVFLFGFTILSFSQFLIHEGGFQKRDIDVVLKMTKMSQIQHPFSSSSFQCFFAIRHIKEFCYQTLCSC